MAHRDELLSYWPLAGLVVRTPRVELRWPSEHDLLALAELAAKGVHPPEVMPFSIPWTRQDPGGDLQRGVLQWNWRCAGNWSADDWSYNPVTVVDGRVVGTQSLMAEKFAIRRTVATGSWLGLEHQGRGIGKEMRAAALHLAFAGLDALRAETAAFVDNDASLGVTRALGYRENGDLVVDREGASARQLGFVLDRAAWEATRAATSRSSASSRACGSSEFGLRSPPSRVTALPSAGNGRWQTPGSGSAWQSAAFGTQRSWVQIPPPRLIRTSMSHGGRWVESAARTIRLRARCTAPRPITAGACASVARRLPERFLLRRSHWRA